jgi:hypothetical protein
MDLVGEMGPPESPGRLETRGHRYSSGWKRAGSFCQPNGELAASLEGVTLWRDGVFGSFGVLDLYRT